MISEQYTRITQPFFTLLIATKYNLAKYCFFDNYINIYILRKLSYINNIIYSVLCIFIYVWILSHLIFHIECRITCRNVHPIEGNEIKLQTNLTLKTVATIFPEQIWLIFFLELQHLNGLWSVDVAFLCRVFYFCLSWYGTLWASKCIHAYVHGHIKRKFKIRFVDFIYCFLWTYGL